MRGGKRTGAGRKQGSSNRELAAVRDALRENREKILRRSIQLALAGNVPLLIALLNKLTPTLHSETIKAEVESRGLADYPIEKKKEIMREYDQGVIERYRKSMGEISETKTEKYMKSLGVVSKSPNTAPQDPPVELRPERQSR